MTILILGIGITTFVIFVSPIIFTILIIFLIFLSSSARW